MPAFRGPSLERHNTDQPVLKAPAPGDEPLFQNDRIEGESWRFEGATECVWVAEGDAIERLIAEFADLTAGKIEAQYHLAVNSGNVRLCALILGERLTEWRRVTVTDDLSRALDLRVEWNDLIGQVRQQLGKVNATARGGEGNRMSQRPRALLKMPRENARQRLQQRIDEADKIVTDPIRSGEDLIKAEEKAKKWRSYNLELLARSLFTTNEYADEYSSSQIPVHQIGDHYDPPGLAALASRLTASIERQVARLDSIIQRLELIDEAPTDEPQRGASQQRSKIFVVHGHDEGALQAMARFLEMIGLQDIVLREQPDQGRTIIEKFEACASEVGFAVALLTPDDLGGPVATLERAARARQNVIFELGYFVGSLGRGRACLLRKGDVEIPSDLFGVIYTDFDHPGEGWKVKLARELRAAGFKFDGDKVLA